MTLVSRVSKVIKESRAKLVKRVTLAILEREHLPY